MIWSRDFSSRRKGQYILQRKLVQIAICADLQAVEITKDIQSDKVELRHLVTLDIRKSSRSDRLGVNGPIRGQRAKSRGWLVC